MTNDLLRWRKESTQDDWVRLARLAGTSVGYLNLVAYGYRRASPKKAEQIEFATKHFNYLPVKKELLVFTTLKISTN
ncbi:transcriptional regulator [Arsenophonus nasoniae]|uniref:Transcriptional regulator n=1 Tax=Arsenophonus nasoniae TaxID=638 RepID=A0AA95GPX5_9GAMM|nr:transcriptional regulator [Arsenophonus nasoniae]WGM01751.1 transcriptional regulator [Arsenophonus nasoniae]